MKSRTKPALRVVPATPVQLSLNVEGVLRDVQHAFYGLCVAAGKQVLAAMMEADRHELCGAHNVPDAKRRAVRGGTTRSAVVLGGQRIAIARPRARSLEHGELKLPAFAWAAQADPLDAATMASMAAGVSTRRYVRTLDPLPAPEEPRSVSKSAVSRRWVALSQAQLHEWLPCSLKELDLPVVMIDGIHFCERVILVALGIDAQGDKHVLGLREGSTESTRVVRSLLSDLIDRGLDADRARLWVIDGGKALRRAIVDCFGQRALVQRCQEHKRRNVVEHLPQELHAGVGRAMRAAWDSGNAVLAKKQLQRLASSLEARHPGATASLREGMDETQRPPTRTRHLTVARAAPTISHNKNPGPYYEFTRWPMTKMTALRLTGASLLSAAALLMAAGAKAQEIRIAVGVDPAYSPIFLAKQANLFSAAGLNVNVVQYTQGGEGVDGMVAGQNQLAAATEATVLNRSTRGDVRALAVFSQSPKFIKLVVRSGITDVKQVKKLGIVPGSVNEFATAKLLDKYQIDPKTVELVRAGPPEFPALLARGDVDGYVLWEPWPANGVKAGGKILAYSGDFGYTYNLVIAASGPWYDTHKAEAKAVVNAVAQACQQITADPSKAGAATQAEAKIPAAQSMELLRDVECRVRDFTTTDLSNYREIAEFLAARKITQSRADVDKVVQTGFFGK